MTPERWQQIEAIFHEVLELDLAERSKFIKKIAGNDDELHAEVVKLLSHYDDASSFIEQPLLDSTKGGVLSALLDEADDDPMTGKLLGTYRIEREIGRGGMGAVYEATRADGEFRLRAAIKIVKRGIDTDFVLKRFRNERQILAALDHPFITRLIDGGTTDDGRPYFVMDYIDGMPLYRYADKNRLTINERLQLFCRICEAVEYAHQKLVIHRDLKPSNLFVAMDGSPRLFDFGIAKLLDPEMASDTLQPTATALRMMTVDYASPEQVRGEKVTYVTDVYSLGVILFELLTGYRPYKLKSRSSHDVARAICDDEPVLPSVAVESKDGGLAVVKVNPIAATLTSVAGLRKESPEHLASQLRGNLDGIILKALAKDSGDRYESVAAFREDIERHLNGEVVAIPIHFPQRATVGPAAGADTKLVAVLPLSLMSPSNMENTDEAYLTVGLADAIITRLTSVRKLTVRPTSSITRYNEHQINPFRAGIELGVDFVLDGRIRRFGDRIRISLQLLDVKAISTIWAGQFDENLTDVLELEDAISAQVAAALIPQLTGEERQKLAKRGTNNPQAYEAYLKGRFYWNQFTIQSFPKAIQSFQRAVELDPEYALAYVGIADFYIWADIYGILPVDESRQPATEAVTRALQLDSELGEAYASLGLIFTNRFDYDRGEEYLLKAIDLNPHNSLAHEWYSAFLIGNGYIEEGLSEIRRAEELDPLSLRTKTMVLWSYYQAGEFQVALEMADEIISLDENYPQGHLQRGYVLSELGRAEEGVASMNHAGKLLPGSSMAKAQLSLVLKAAGRHAKAVEIADELKAKSENEYVKAIFLAFTSFAAGRVNEAFEYFDKAVDVCDPWLAWFGTDIKLEPLRTDPRYLEIMGRIGKGVTSGRRRLRKDTKPNLRASLDAQTVLASEMPTLAYRPNFARRYSKSIVATVIVLIGLFAAYSTGVLTVSFTNNGGTAADNATRSVAVLPFENATGDVADAYISDGMSESLMARMASSSEIRTISRAAAFSYKGKQIDPQVAGRELGVDSVLRGTLTKKNDEYKVSTELIRVSDGKKLFSMYFVEKSDHIVALQDEMISRVVETVNIQTTGKTVVAQKGYTENNEAFQFYLKGEFNRQKSTPNDTERSIENYQAAIKLDPNYALAYQGMALAYRSAPDYGFLTPKEAYSKAEEAAKKALTLDPSLSTAYVALASLKAAYEWNFPEAEAEYKRAIALGPNSAEAHLSYGNFLVTMGRSDEAIVEFRNALQIDPNSSNIQTNIAWATYIAGRYDEATAQITHVIDRDPAFARAYLNYGEILQEQGKFNDAILAIRKAGELSHDPIADMALGHAYAVAGRKREAEQIAADLENGVRSNKLSPFLPAVVYAGLNDKDKAFYWLERAYQDRSNWLTLIKVGRRLKNLRGDPRFDDLLKRVGFDEGRS